MKTIFGFFAAPVVPILLIFLVQMFVIEYSEALSFFLTLTPIAYTIAIIFGVPMYMVLKSKRIFKMRTYVLCGTIFGLIPYGVFFVSTYFSTDNTGYTFLLLKNTVGYSLLGACCGMVASFVFWFLVVRDFR